MVPMDRFFSLGCLHALKGSFDGNQVFAQNANSIEKAVEGVFMNLGWFSHNASHCTSGIGEASARWRTR